MSTDSIGNKQCELCRDNFTKEVKRTEHRLDSHLENLGELTQISIKLTQMQESQKEILEQMNKRLNLVEKALVESEIKERVEKQVAERIAKNTIVKEFERNRFWDRFANSSAFLPVTLTGCVVILSIVIGAVGQDSLEFIKTLFVK